MEGFPVNPVDILVALVMLISALVAFSRGAVREILGVSAWVGAALVAVSANLGAPCALKSENHM